ncbi:MAG: choice-of-anchor D domain-containing protein, partial [Planctomycetota bacterium]
MIPRTLTSVLPMALLVWVLPYAATAQSSADAVPSESATINTDTAAAPPMTVGLIGESPSTLGGQVARPYVFVPFSPGVAVDAIFVGSVDSLHGLPIDRREAVEQFIVAGVPLVLRGGEADAAAALRIEGLDVAAQRSGFFALALLPDGRRKRAYFLTSEPWSSQYRVDMETGEQHTLIEFAPVLDPEAVVDVVERQLAMRALDWARDARLRGGHRCSHGYRGDVDYGAWNAIDEAEWQWLGASPSGDDYCIIYTLTARAHKIQDAYADKDWYLVEARLHHQLPVDCPYREGCAWLPFMDEWCGWYVQNGGLQVERRGSAGYNTLDDYGPTTTVSGSSYTISIGGSITTDPGAGITASYSRTVSREDVKIIDRSSLYSSYCDWEEDYVCPEGDYSWCPWPTWPTDPSKSSFYLWYAAIYRTTDVAQGVKLSISPLGFDRIDHTWCDWLGLCFIQTFYHLLEPPDATRSFSPFYNYTPEVPDTPSGPTQAWVNSSYEYCASAFDHDGANLSYRFDFDDGAPSSWGESCRSHTWTSPGTVGVRAQAKDAPHDATSGWSDSKVVNVNSLDRLEISGPPEVCDQSTAYYDCTAYFHFGSSQVVTPSWSIVTGGACASISGSGVLTTYDVTGSCTVVIRATYTDHGVTKSRDKQVIVNDCHRALLSCNKDELENSCYEGENAPSQSFEVWNGGTGTLTYDISDDVSWLDCDPDHGTSNGEHDRIDVDYSTSSLSTGDYSATITIEADDADGSPHTIDVTLHVLPQPQPQLSLSPGSYDFTRVLVGDSMSHAFTLRNTGGQTATGSVYLTGPNASEFQFSPDSDEIFPIPPGESRSILVTFEPTSLGPKYATLQVDCSNCDNVSASLSGTGAEQCLDLSPMHWDFGAVEVNDCSEEEQEFTLINTGEQVEMGTVSLTGADAVDFEIASGGGSVPLHPGVPHLVFVEFCPETEGPKHAELSVQGTTCLDVAASLSGTAAPEQLGDLKP